MLNKLNPITAIVCGMMLHSTLSFAGELTPSEFSSPEFTKVAATVQELLVIDARMAMQQLRKRELEASGQSRAGQSPQASIAKGESLPQPLLGANAGAEQQKPAAPKPIVKPKLEGIFGLGDRLFADVEFDGQKVRFQRGQKYPVGMGTSFPYQLVSIAAPCVKVQGKGSTETLCIDGLTKE
ncbi:hypothetical protein M0K88_004698 [Escherichia coli]|nr:hypothetical protein [Escherichia coli]